MCVCVCVRACVRACARACACVRVWLFREFSNNPHFHIDVHYFYFWRLLHFGLHDCHVMIFLRMSMSLVIFCIVAFYTMVAIVLYP